MINWKSKQKLFVEKPVKLFVVYWLKFKILNKRNQDFLNFSWYTIIDII